MSPKHQVFYSVLYISSSDLFFSFLIALNNAFSTYSEDTASESRGNRYAKYLGLVLFQNVWFGFSSSAALTPLTQLQKQEVFYSNSVTQVLLPSYHLTRSVTEHLSPVGKSN